MFLPRTWNNGIMELWNVVFKGIFLLFETFPPMSTINFSNVPTSQFPKTQYSIIPLFQHSNYEQSELSSADDLQARRISAAENIQREDLSAIEEVEAIVEIEDAELIEDKQYASMGKKPAVRVKALLG
jgi:hypothetical protein